MSYRYANARSLDGKPKIGDAECVTLIRHYTDAPATRLWRQGAKVLGKKGRSPDGAYFNPTDNADAFWVIE